ncbi:MAG: hypothetical protein KDA93_23110 [Planctomycetaceae bacterium]|nr:hypothetical protein [Planctomycetaceae bacterium]
MPRLHPFLTIAAVLAIAGSSLGCANLLTARSIQTFADSLAEKDLENLKLKTSSEFDQKALRTADALDDIKILNLPTGKVSVASVEEISETEKHVTVEVGERKKEVLYKLVREPGSRKWLVDDIYLQQKKPGMDEPITKSVTETMDLLLTVREFLDSWQTGGRDDVLAVTTSEFHGLLADLSPTHLLQLTTHVVGKSSARGSFRPEARMEDDRAVVLLPRKGGTLIVELTLNDSDWLVSDVAIESHDDDQQVRSAKRVARILKTTSEFLASYEANDQQQLQSWCTVDFYRNSVSVADLSSAPLPTGRLLTSPYKLRVHEENADLVIDIDDATYMITLAEPTSDGTKAGGKPYQVSEVTLYEADGKQVKRLSAVFTTQAMVQIFAQAYVTGDLDRLKQASTSDFTQLAWDQLDAELLASLPLNEFENVPPNIVATQFRGPLTEVTVTQGTRALTYILRESRGRMAVDDVLLPVSQRPTSMKQNLQAIIPVYAMARAIHANDLVTVRRSSSSDLDRLVWQPLGEIPNIGFNLVDHLTTPITSIALTEDRAELVLGDDNWGARCTLLRGEDHFVVDDVRVIAGPSESQQADLKTAGRLNVAQNLAE